MRSFQRKKPKMTASFMLTAVEEGVCVTERERGGVETVVCVCVFVVVVVGGCSSSSSSSWFMSLV